jgi:hypothetical protein
MSRYGIRKNRYGSDMKSDRVVAARVERVASLEPGFNKIVAKVGKI